MKEPAALLDTVQIITKPASVNRHSSPTVSDSRRVAVAIVVVLQPVVVVFLPNDESVGVIAQREPTFSLTGPFRRDQRHTSGRVPLELLDGAVRELLAHDAISKVVLERRSATIAVDYLCSPTTGVIGCPADPAIEVVPLCFVAHRVVDDPKLLTFAVRDY